MGSDSQSAPMSCSGIVSEYQLPAAFSWTIAPLRVSNSTTLAVGVSTVPFTAICRPLDVD